MSLLVALPGSTYLRLLHPDVTFTIEAYVQPLGKLWHPEQGLPVNPVPSSGPASVEKLKKAESVKVTVFVPLAAALMVFVMMPCALSALLEPMVHVPSVAMPDAFVAGVVPVAEPPPPMLLNVTVAPETRFPNASLMRTAGFVAAPAPTWTIWLLPLEIVAVEGEAALTVTFCVCVIPSVFAVAETV